jgi:hypothetical protein
VDTHSPFNYSADQERITYLEKKIRTKDEVLAEMMAEHVAINKCLGQGNRMNESYRCSYCRRIVTKPILQGNFEPFWRRWYADCSEIGRLSPRLSFIKSEK